MKKYILIVMLMYVCISVYAMQDMARDVNKRMQKLQSFLQERSIAHLSDKEIVETYNTYGPVVQNIIISKNNYVALVTTFELVKDLKAEVLTRTIQLCDKGYGKVRGNRWNMRVQEQLKEKSLIEAVTFYKQTREGFLARGVEARMFGKKESWTLYDHLCCSQEQQNDIFVLYSTFKVRGCEFFALRDLPQNIQTIISKQNYSNNSLLLLFVALPAVVTGGVMPFFCEHFGLEDVLVGGVFGGVGGFLSAMVFNFFSPFMNLSWEQLCEKYKQCNKGVVFFSIDNSE